MTDRETFRRPKDWTSGINGDCFRRSTSLEYFMRRRAGASYQANPLRFAASHTLCTAIPRLRLDQAESRSRLATPSTWLGFREVTGQA